jgi:hypothetical protein
VALTAVLAALSGCGGGAAPFNPTALFQATAGKTWKYKISGTVTLPANKGGGTHTISSTSKLTVSAATSTVTDAGGGAVSQLDRVFDIILADTREIHATLRLYYTQTAAGIFVHGFNNFQGTAFNPANSKFVSTTANPPLKFLYIPDPAAEGFTSSYSNPFGIAGTADNSYTFTITNQARQKITVPAGEFNVQVATQTEAWNKLGISSAAFDPPTGLIAANVDVILPDGSRLQGVIELTQAP